MQSFEGDALAHVVHIQRQLSTIHVEQQAIPSLRVNRHRRAPHLACVHWFKIIGVKPPTLPVRSTDDEFIIATQWAGCCDEADGRISGAGATRIWKGKLPVIGAVRNAEPRAHEPVLALLVVARSACVAHLELIVAERHPLVPVVP